MILPEVNLTKPKKQVIMCLNNHIVIFCKSCKQMRANNKKQNRITICDAQLFISMISLRLLFLGRSHFQIQIETVEGLSMQLEQKWKTMEFLFSFFDWKMTSGPTHPMSCHQKHGERFVLPEIETRVVTKQCNLGERMSLWLLISEKCFTHVCVPAVCITDDAFPDCMLPEISCRSCCRHSSQWNFLATLSYSCCTRRTNMYQSTTSSGETLHERKELQAPAEATSSWKLIFVTREHFFTPWICHSMQQVIWWGKSMESTANNIHDYYFSSSFVPSANLIHFYPSLYLVSHNE